MQSNFCSEKISIIHIFVQNSSLLHNRVKLIFTFHTWRILNSKNLGFLFNFWVYFFAWILFYIQRKSIFHERCLWNFHKPRPCPFIQILSRFCPDFIQISSRFYPDLLETHFIQILSRFYPDFLETHFIQILS